MEQTISESINLEISFRDRNMSLVRTVIVDSDKTIYPDKLFRNGFKDQQAKMQSLDVFGKL